MKKYAILTVTLVGLLVLGYFIMWFFLCQTHAAKVSSLVGRQLSLFVAGDRAAALAEQRTAARKFGASFPAHKASRFYQKLNSIMNKYDFVLADATAPASETVGLTLLNYWAEMIKAAEERGEYASGTVPLGALKPLLAGFSAAYETVVPVMTNRKPDPLIVGPVVERYRDFQYLLKGKDEVLASYLVSSDTNLQSFALAEILGANMKSLLPRTVRFFRVSASEPLKYQAARTIAGLKDFRETDVNDFIKAKLATPRLMPDPDFLFVLGNSKIPSFYETVSMLTNSTNASVRDAAADASSRLRRSR